MGEENKPSSLRTRIERKRKTYEQKVNWRAVLVELAVVIVAAAALAYTAWI